MMRSDYPFDSFQPIYFVIENFAALLEKMETTSLKEIYEFMDGSTIIPAGETNPSDVNFPIYPA